MLSTLFVFTSVIARDFGSLDAIDSQHLSETQNSKGPGENIPSTTQPEVSPTMTPASTAGDRQVSDGSPNRKTVAVSKKNIEPWVLLLILFNTVIGFCLACYEVYASLK